MATPAGTGGEGSGQADALPSDTLTRRGRLHKDRLGMVGAPGLLQILPGPLCGTGQPRLPDWVVNHFSVVWASTAQPPPDTQAHSAWQSVLSGSPRPSGRSVSEERSVASGKLAVAWLGPFLGWRQGPGPPRRHPCRQDHRTRHRPSLRCQRSSRRWREGQTCDSLGHRMCDSLGTSQPLCQRHKYLPPREREPWELGKASASHPDQPNQWILGGDLVALWLFYCKNVGCKMYHLKL